MRRVTTKKRDVRMPQRPAHSVRPVVAAGPGWTMARYSNRNQPIQKQPYDANAVPANVLPFTSCGRQPPYGDARRISHRVTQSTAHVDMHACSVMHSAICPAVRPANPLSCADPHDSQFTQHRALHHLLLRKISRQTQKTPPWKSALKLFDT